MTSFEGSGERNNPVDREPFNLLAETIVYTFDDALDLVAQKINEDKLRIEHQKRKVSMVEYVQFDETSFDGRTLRVLLTSSGGKPETGVEKIKLLAHPVRHFESIADAAIANATEDTLAFMMNELYIAHQQEDGTWRYSKTDGLGLYPWRPRLLPTSLANDFEPYQSEEYAEDLAVKLISWDVVPQN